MKTLGNSVKINRRYVRVTAHDKISGLPYHMCVLKDIKPTKGIIVGLRTIWEGESIDGIFIFEQKINVALVAINLKQIIKVPKNDVI